MLEKLPEKTMKVISVKDSLKQVALDVQSSHSYIYSDMWMKGCHFSKKKNGEIVVKWKYIRHFS